MANFYDNDDGKMSEFNSAALKMKRLDKIQELLNQINGNLLALNDQYGVYNYELKLSLCDSLYQEVESKLTEEEREDGERLREFVEKMISENPVYKNKKEKIYPYREKQTMDKENWKIIKKALFFYEKVARKYMDAHGMDTAYADESDLF